MSSVGTRSSVPSISSFRTFREHAAAGRKSATAAAMTTASAFSAAADTAFIISFAERTCSTFRNGGSGSRVGPVTSVTSAPKRRATDAIANPSCRWRGW